MTDEVAPDEVATLRARWTRAEVARYLLGAAVGCVVLLVLAGKRTELVAAVHQLGHVQPGFALAAVAAEALSLAAFSWLQRLVLRLGGAPRPALASLFLVSLANNAIANSVPGEPAVSSAYRYRFYRRSGASGASAGWTIFTVLIAQAIGMAVLVLLGVLIALAASRTARAAGVAILGLAIVVAAGSVLIRRDLVLRLAAALIRLLRRAGGQRLVTFGASAEATLARMREIPLGAAATAGVVVIAAAVWACDFLCLLCSFGAVSTAIPWDGVLLAYGAAQIVATLPLVPGGIGIAEGSLAVILVAYGVARIPAISVALVFRAVSFWLAIAIGWISFAALARHGRIRG